MIKQNRTELKEMGLWRGTGQEGRGSLAPTENKLFRLAFHDCIPYEDGTGGCDGCLNWEGMTDKTQNVFKKEHHYQGKPADKTNNQFLDFIVYNLEKIYTVCL